MDAVSDKQIWLEVYDVAAQRWLTIDHSGEIIEDMRLIEDNLHKPVTYIVSYDNGRCRQAGDC